MALDSPTWAPSGPKMVLKCCNVAQDGPKIIPRGPIEPQDGPKESFSLPLRRLPEKIYRSSLDIRSVAEPTPEHSACAKIKYPYRSPNSHDCATRAARTTRAARADKVAMAAGAAMAARAAEAARAARATRTARPARAARAA